MATRVSKVSDLDGAPEADFGAVVRDYPGLDSARILDVTKAQADDLMARAVKNVVTIELRMPDSSVRDVLVSKAELDKWLGNEDTLQKAAHLRGRKAGPLNGH